MKLPYMVIAIGRKRPPVGHGTLDALACDGFYASRLDADAVAQRLAEVGGPGARVFVVEVVKAFGDGDDE